MFKPLSGRSQHQAQSEPVPADNAGDGALVGEGVRQICEINETHGQGPRNVSATRFIPVQPHKCKEECDQASESLSRKRVNSTGHLPRWALALPTCKAGAADGPQETSVREP